MAFFVFVLCNNLHNSKEKYFVKLLVWLNLSSYIADSYREDNAK
jgi:hypothetical protein